MTGISEEEQTELFLLSQRTSSLLRCDVRVDSQKNIMVLQRASFLFSIRPSDSDSDTEAGH
jgi:hypothetical protein